MNEQDNPKIEIKNDNEIIELLRKQNEKLEFFQKSLYELAEKEEGKENYLQMRTRVTDFNMSFVNMVVFSFKWFFATLPLGILLYFLYTVIF